MFASTGEKLEDFDVFHPDRMAVADPRHGRRADPHRAGRGARSTRTRRSGWPPSCMGGESVHARGLPRAAASRVRRMGPIANILGDDARHGPDEGPAGRARRQALRPDHRDHPLDDPGRAEEPEDHQRLPPGPHRQRLRGHRDGRQPAAQPLRRGAEDDEADGRHDGHARHAAQGDQVAEEQAQGHQGRRVRPRRPAGLPGGWPAGSGGMPRACPPRRSTPSWPSTPKATATGLPPAGASELPQDCDFVEADRSVDKRVEWWAWRCMCAGWCCPTTRSATCGWSATGSRSSRYRGRRPSPTAASSCPGWSTRTATSASRRGGAPDRVGRRGPGAGARSTATPACWRCATPARRTRTPELDDDPDVPRLARAGRHVAPPQRYLRGHRRRGRRGRGGRRRSAAQAAAGNGWVKLVGDWIDRDVGDLAPAWDPATMAGGGRGGARRRGPGGRARVRRGVGGGAGRGPGSTRSSTAPGSDRRRHRRDGPAGHRAGTHDDQHRDVRRDRRSGRRTKFPGYAAHMRALRDGFPAVVRGGVRGGRADLCRHRRRRRHRATA